MVNINNYGKGMPMKIIKKIITIILSSVLLFTSSLIVFADDSEKVNTEEISHVEENLMHEASILSVAVCPYCDGSPVPVCVGDRVDNGIGFDCYFYKDCYVVRYQRKTYLRCSACPNLYVYHGYHDCAEEHSSCGMGLFTICLF